MLNSCIVSCGKVFTSLNELCTQFLHSVETVTMQHLILKQGYGQQSTFPKCPTLN